MLSPSRKAEPTFRAPVLACWPSPPASSAPPSTDSGIVKHDQGPRHPLVPPMTSTQRGGLNPLSPIHRSTHIHSCQLLRLRHPCVRSGSSYSLLLLSKLLPLSFVQIHTSPSSNPFRFLRHSSSRLAPNAIVLLSSFYAISRSHWVIIALRNIPRSTRSTPFHHPIRPVIGFGLDQHLFPGFVW